MSGSTIQRAKKFPFDDVTVTYAAGWKNGIPTVVTGFITGLPDLPSVTIDNQHLTMNAAIAAVDAVTSLDAEQARSQYMRDYDHVVGRVVSALNSTKYTPPIKDTRRASR